MKFGALGEAAAGIEPLYELKLIVPVAVLALFWLWETWQPFFGWHGERWRHGARNVALALLNAVILAVAFGVITVAVAEWTAQRSLGLLHLCALPSWASLVLALVILDGWMYLWHRANHVIPLLWRFHRVHHSDRRMDVTTATRFHLGEHVGAVTLRLGLTPLFGLSVLHLVAYEILVIAVTQLHHANISLGRWDKWLRLVIVTPDMHKVHHSNWRPETDSNYSTVLSFWDRVAGSFRLRTDPRTLQFGLVEFPDPQWQTVWGMLKTPFVAPVTAMGRTGVPIVSEPLDQIRTSVRERFTQTANEPHAVKKFPLGPASAKRLGYAPAEVDALPQTVTESFCGVGNPLSLGDLTVGQSVLDIGCGAGFDVALAARRVGADGKVVGVDMTDAMVAKARRNVAVLRAANIEIHQGEVDRLPIDDESVDVAISNGVFNLCVDKPRVLREVFRVLRSGGRLQMADILLEPQVTPEQAAKKGAWSD